MPQSNSWDDIGRELFTEEMYEAVAWAFFLRRRWTTVRNTIANTSYHISAVFEPVANRHSRCNDGVRHHILSPVRNRIDDLGLLRR